MNQKSLPKFIFLLSSFLFLFLANPQSFSKTENISQDTICECELNPPVAEETAFQNETTNSLDSIYKDCEAYLISKLGKCVYCKYVLHPGHIIIFNTLTTKTLKIQFRFVLPQQYKNDSTISIDNDGDYFDFNYYISMNGEVVNPLHPYNVPDCNGTIDCGYKITKDDAINIAREKGFIESTDDFKIENNSTEWLIKKTSDKEHERVYINMRTGEMSEIEHGR